MHETARSGGGRPDAGARRPTAVVFSGGGTGGHLYPALALARALVSLRPDVRPFFVGASRGIEARVLPGRDVEHLLLPIRGLERGSPLAGVRVVGPLLRSMGAVAEAYRSLRPEVVVVTGGYAGGPAGIVAALMGVPLVLQEQNSVPGLTVRQLSRVARQVHVAYPEAVDHLPSSARGRASVSGNPIEPPVPLDRGKARRKFGLAREGRVALVVGGSQGAAALNRAVIDGIRAVREGRLGRPPGLQLLWATGPAHLQRVYADLEDAGSPEWVRATGYIDDMPAALASADVAVSRAGAMATSEFLSWGLPAILVPLPTAAANHQERNARALEAAGAALHLPEAGLDGETLWAAVVDLAGNDALLEEMSATARERGRPRAAAAIARSIAELLPAPPPGWRAEGGTA